MKMDDRNFRSKYGVPSVLALMCVGLAACTTEKLAKTEPDIPVNIIFDSSHCPQSVAPNTPVDISKAADQRILWQSVNEDGENVAEDYWIFFDPFKNGHLKSNGQGFKKSPKISSDAPIGVEYKYTIEGQKCKDKPLDPRFFLT